MNIKEIVYKVGLKTDDIKLVPKINEKLLGKRLKGSKKIVEAEICKLTQEEMFDFEQTGLLTVAGFEINGEELTIIREYIGDTKRYEACGYNEIVAVLDTFQDEDMELEGIKREIINRVQRLRKESELLSTDEGIRVFYDINGKTEKVNKVMLALTRFFYEIQAYTKTILAPTSELKEEPFKSSENKIFSDDCKIELKLIKNYTKEITIY